MDRFIEWLRPRLRAAATLGVLAILMLLAVAVGWAALTEPLPELTTDDRPPPACVSRQVAAGERVEVSQVTVSVFNAGRTDGLASSTMADFLTRGFGRGQTGNAPPDVDVRRAQIWAPDPLNPAVRLVRSHLGRQATVVRPSRRPLGLGVVVVVGDDFRRLVKGLPAVRATRPARICVPTPPD